MFSKVKLNLSLILIAAKSNRFSLFHKTYVENPILNDINSGLIFNYKNPGPRLFAKCMKYIIYDMVAQCREKGCVVHNNICPTSFLKIPFERGWEISRNNNFKF